MAQECVLALDQGTTGCRAILLNSRSEIVASHYLEITQYYPHPGWIEHDPDEIWQATHSCIEAVLSKGNVDPGQIACIGITNQRETSVVWDKDTGRPLHKAIVWACRRTAPICERLKEAGLEKEVRERTGLTVDPWFSATKLMWYRENVPEIREAMARHQINVGTIDSWLMWKLTGGKIHATDCSNASRTMLFNVRTLSWDDFLLDAMDLPKDILPEVKPSSGIFGYTSEESFFGKRVPISGVGGDQMTALFGQACFTPGMIKNTYGTSLCALMNIGNRFVLSEHRLLTDLAWNLGGEVTYAFEGPVFTGGSIVRWLRDGLGIIKETSDVEQLASQATDTKGVYFIPAFTGLSAPYWDPYARGTIVGITAGTSREHIALAALEGLGYRTRDIIEVMSSDSGQKVESLRVDGGATSNNFLMQLQADILGIPLELPVVSEITVTGAAWLAGLGIGMWKDKENILGQWKIKKVFEPHWPEDRRQTRYEAWKHAVQRSLGWAKDCGLS